MATDAGVGAGATETDGAHALSPRRLANARGRDWAALAAAATLTSPLLPAGVAIALATTGSAVGPHVALMAWSVGLGVVGHATLRALARGRPDADRWRRVARETLSVGIAGCAGDLLFQAFHHVAGTTGDGIAAEGAMMGTFLWVRVAVVTMDLRLPPVRRHPRRAAATPGGGGG